MHGQSLLSHVCTDYWRPRFAVSIAMIGDEGILEIIFDDESVEGFFFFFFLRVKDESIKRNIFEQIRKNI